MILGIVIGVLVFGLGIWIGLGSPGLRGREDRWNPHGARRLHRNFTPLDWLRPPRRR